MIDFTLARISIAHFISLIMVNGLDDLVIQFNLVHYNIGDPFQLNIVRVLLNQLFEPLINPLLVTLATNDMVDVSDTLNTIWSTLTFFSELGLVRLFVLFYYLGTT